MRENSMTRIGAASLGLVLAALGGWYAGMPGVQMQTARAETVQTQPVATHRYGHWRYGGIPLETLRNAETRLDSVRVRNTHDDRIGWVRSVVVGRKGQPEQVNVAFGGFLGFGVKVVSLEADTLAYDPRYNEVLTAMTPREMEIIAARPELRAY